MSEEVGENESNNASRDRPMLFDGPSMPGGDSGNEYRAEDGDDLFYSKDGPPLTESEIEDKLRGPEIEEPLLNYGPLNHNETDRIPDVYGHFHYTIPLALPAPESFKSAPFASSSADTSVLGGQFNETQFRGRFGGQDNLDENSHHYVGLVNQAMTCYLNSLIQTLYMTPEFRNAIYNWKFNGNPAEETKNIPYQLQKLFLLLQTSDKYSLETKDLTASFGWESNDAYDQHDVQELCRLMFDALEHRWKKTENRSLIQDLYKGTIEDYVKCLKCKTEKVKPDVFLDLPLAVKQFGATESYKSVEEAMRAFIKPEVLNGNNQYKCEKCNSKQDAEKGLRITHFPYLLTCQLKRFDFDYNTLHRIKLNDRMSFPDYIDVNDFVHGPNPSTHQSSPSPTSKHSYASMAAKKSPPPTIKEEDELKSEEKPLNSQDFPSVQQSSSSTSEEKGEDADGCWLNVSRDSEKVAAMLTRGKYIYELISIMVHQGNASGGHYFAYIKNVDQNRWFCFNDSSVQAAQMNDIFRTFGGPTGGWYVSNTNAYMLIYRQVDPVANKSFIRTCNLPVHLLRLKEKLVEDEKEKIRKQRFQEEHIKVHYLCNEALYLCNEPGSTLILKNTSLSSVFDQLISKFEQQFTTVGSNHLPAEILDNSRLIMCDSNWLMKEHIDDLENKTLEDIVDCEFSSIIKPDIYLMLDTVACEHDTYPFYQFPTKHFKTYEVNLVDIKEESIKLFKRVCLDNSSTIAEVKSILRGIIKSFMFRSPTYSIDPKDDMDILNTEKMRIIIDKGNLEETSPLIVVDSDSQQIGSVEMPSYGKVQMYIDFGPSDLLAADREGKDIRESKMFKIIERKKFSTKLKIVLPSSSDYRRAGMVPQIMDPSFMPPTSSDISSSCMDNSSNSVTAVLPFPSSSSLNTYDSSYPTTSNTYSSGIERMESVSGTGEMGMLPVSYSLQDPTPPPAYSLRASDCLPRDNSDFDQGSPVSSANNECEEDRMDDMSPCVSTPKRSPEVSEGSGDEMGNSNLAYHNYPGSNMEIVQSKLLRLVEGDPDAGSDWRANVINQYAPTDNWSAGATTGIVGDKPSDKDSACETLLGGESTSDSTPSTSIYTIGLVALDTTSEAPCIEVEVDRRQLCAHLKNWLAQYLNLDPSNFVIIKHFNDHDDGFPTNHSEMETIRESYSHISHLAVKLHVSTKSNEKAIMINSFDLQQPDHQKWTVLFHLPCSEKTLVSSLLEKCRELLSRSYDLHYKLEQLRFRDLSENGAVALKRGMTLESRGQNQWHRNLYLQILKEEELTENLEECVPVMIQRWCPSTLEVMPVFEVHLPLDTPEPSKVLRRLIAKHADLPVERIQISDAFPNIGWMKWPYNKSVLELFDSVKFKGEGAVTPSHLGNCYNGKLVYYKDSNEFKRDISEDERKSIRIKENVGSLSAYQSSNPARRKERPLRIQMSSVSESDP